MTRQEEKRHESSVTKVDIDNLEKEVCIDIAELRKDLRALRRDLLLPSDSLSVGDLQSRKNSSGISEGGHPYSGKGQAHLMSERSFFSETSVPEEDDNLQVSVLHSYCCRRWRAKARVFVPGIIFARNALP